MMPTIRIDNDVWNSLKKKAEPFEDTPNSVLRRLLRLDARHEGGRRLPTGSRTPQAAYRKPILQVLDELGGKARADEVLEHVGKKMRNSLRAADLQQISTGMVRWRNAAMWERKAMVDEGLLSSQSLRGIWELTAKGRSLLTE